MQIGSWRGALATALGALARVVVLAVDAVDDVLDRLGDAARGDAVFHIEIELALTTALSFADGAL